MQRKYGGSDQMKVSKFGNRKTVFNGEVFDSLKEANRYRELLILQRTGKIKDLDRQVKFTLLPSQKDANGKTIERPINYYADFVYTDTATNKRIVEDVKGMRTDAYILKRKIMLAWFGIRIKET